MGRGAAAVFLRPKTKNAIMIQNTNEKKLEESPKKPPPAAISYCCCEKAIGAGLETGEGPATGDGAGEGPGVNVTATGRPVDAVVTGALAVTCC
jgi:hypothetical protein